MKPLNYILCASLAMLLAPLHAALAGEVEEQGRAIFQKNRDAVVTVELVVNIKSSGMGGPSRENEVKTEATGTVIGEDGLTVVALSSTDPTSIMRNVMGGMMGFEGFQMDTVVSDVKILRHDGREIPAQVILRDNELDLAFVRPSERPSEPFTHVDFSEAGSPQILDYVLSLNRLGRVANRAYAASFERIEAIVERPRTFYIPGKDPTQTGSGSPAFTLDGRPVGIFVMRSIRGDTGGSGMFENVTPIILPVRDILESAEQVPAFGEEPEEPVEIGEPDTDVEEEEEVDIEADVAA